MVSFSSVVGYQTTKSSAIAKASPLFTIRTSRAIDEESNECNCQDASRDNLAKAVKLLTRLEVYINLILSRYKHIPEVAEKCQEILYIINSDGIREIFCYVLMRIGISIEELGEKVFQVFKFIYFMLELMMIPIVILWNMYCDELADYSSHKNHMI